MSININRRRFPRFTVQPGYTPIALRTLDQETFDNEGHAYDISEGGLRFDVDRHVPPGTPVAIRVTMPALSDADVGDERNILMLGNIVWTEDEDEPGPVRTAATITHFIRAGDRERLLKHFASGHYHLAA